MVDIDRLRSWDDPGETICAEAAAEIERMLAALKKIKGALENGALVPLDGYSDEIACLTIIDAALGDQQQPTTKKDAHFPG